MKLFKRINAALLALLIVVALAIPATAIFMGCASLSAGADPLVVRVEQGETGANATFDFVLHEDQANRGFWETNAPAFHNFCEWLRTPTVYTGTNVPRCVAMQLNVDDLKLSYKASKTAGNSNALFSAFAVLSTAFSEASSWQGIVTNSVHP